MTIVSKEQMCTLIDLQQIESEAYRINKIIGAVDSKIQALDSQLKTFTASLAEKEKHLSAIKEKYRIYEAEFKEKEERIKKSRETLKIVKTNKEYQVLLREIDENVKHNSQIEELLIHDLEIIEKEEQEIASDKAALMQLESQIEGQKMDIRNECTEEREELVRIDEKRKDISTRIDPKLLTLFNRTLKASGGLAVAPVVNCTCKGCNINIPPQKFIEIQQGETLYFCQQCHRILYFKQEEVEEKN